MMYRAFKDLNLSLLGFGAMRLPVLDGNDAAIDEKAVKEMVAFSMEKGVNYFDTAWLYHSGNSEVVMGKILSEYPRDRFYLASKFPGYDLSNMDKAESIFEKQLEKCGVDYFDFYLFHNVCEMNIDAYLDKKFGIFGYLWKQKKNGRIRHLGFSAHGGIEVIKRFLDAYGDYMEFCQIQLNYLDWTFQNAREKVTLLNEHKIPIWVMEPLRGGRLARLPQENAAALKALRPDEDTPAWAFRFLETIPGVTVILSGMSDLAQVRENISIFETKKPLNEQERKTLQAIADDLLKNTVVPCTACRYCMSHCPQGLDIPRLLELYNEHCFTVSGGLVGFIAPFALQAIPEEKRPASCIACKSCEAVCPQNIRISEVLSDFNSRLTT